MYFPNFSKLKILCVGDIILDSYVTGNVQRVSPEAPIPIFDKKSERFVLGGAGNVARNISSGGGSCHLISLVGKDDRHETLRKLIKLEKNITVSLIQDSNRSTTKKTRFISSQQQLLRVDEESVNKINEDIEEKLFTKIKKVLPKSDLIVISDYAKGLLTDSITRKILNLANKFNVISVVDPKKKSFESYSNSKIITPNLKELFDASEIQIKSSESENKKIELISRDLMKKFNIMNFLVTRSSEGMTLVSRKSKISHFSSNAIEVFDVSGAGDTVVAYLSLAYASKIDLKNSVRIANKAASLSVAKLGTASVNYEEVFNDKKTIEKNFSLKDAKKQLKKNSFEKLGFTNGCFDILHSGHISYLKQSKKNCDFLIIGLNSDNSIKKIKGKGRPIINIEDRILLLSSLTFVDMIVVFDELTPIKLIKHLKPHILFKGKDYKLDQVVGSEEIKSWGGKVMLIDYESGKSTSNIIRRIKDGS